MRSTTGQGIVALVAVIAGLLIGGQNQTGEVGPVYATEFVLVDGKGNVLGVLGPMAGAGSLTLYSASGENSVGHDSPPLAELDRETPRDPAVLRLSGKDWQRMKRAEEQRQARQDRANARRDEAQADRDARRERENARKGKGSSGSSRPYRIPKRGGR